MRDEPAQVDQPADRRLVRGNRERACRLPVGLGKRVSRTQGVNQVVRHLDAVERLRDIVGVAGVALDDLHVARPHHVAQPPAGSGHDADAETGGQQLGDQATTDVPRRSGDEAAHLVGHGVKSSGGTDGPHPENQRGSETSESSLREEFAPGSDSAVSWFSRTSVVLLVGISTRARRMRP